MTAEECIEKGYFVVSRRYCTLVRIDRDDWKEYMAIQGYPWSLKEGLKWVKTMGFGAGDQYRRVYSKDTIVVDRSLIRKIPNSGARP